MKTITTEASNTETTELARSIESALERMSHLSVDNDEQAQEAATFLKRIKSLHKAITNFYEPERKARYESYKEVTDLIGKETEPLQRAEKRVKTILADYRTRQAKRAREIAEQKRREQEDFRLREAERTNNEDILDQPLHETKAEQPTKPEGVYYVTQWHWEVTDESAIPREFLATNDKKINEYVRTHKADAKISGIRIYSEQSARIR